MVVGGNWRNGMRVTYRESATIDSQRGAIIMGVSEPFLGFATMGLIFFGLAGLAFALTSDPDLGGLFVAVFVWVGTALTMGLPLVRKVTLSEDGIRSRSPWTGITLIPWRSVERITFRNWGTASLRIRADDGRTIVIPWYLNGMQQLRSELERRVRRGITEEAYLRYRTFLAAP